MNLIRNWAFILLMYAFGLVAAWLFLFQPGDAVPEQVLLRTGIAVGSGVLAFLFLVVWFAFSNRDLNRVTQNWFLTTVWTLLLFIPIIQFVSFYPMARHIHKAQAATGVTGFHPVVTFILLWLLLPLGVALSQIQMQRIDWDYRVRPNKVWWQAPPGAPAAWYPTTQAPAGDRTHPGGPDHGAPTEVLQDVDEEDTGVHEGPPGSHATHAIMQPPVKKRPSRTRWSPLELEQDPPSLEARVHPEVTGMPASAVATPFFSLASLPLGLLGPAGIAAGLMGLYCRDRFLDLEQRRPGHRGYRFVSVLHWPALGGIIVGSAVSAWMLVTLFLIT